MRGQGQTGGLNRESPAAPRNLGRGQNGSEAAENVEQRGVEAAKRLAPVLLRPRNRMRAINERRPHLRGPLSV